MDREEYKIFRELEEKRYGQQVADGFSSVDQFVALANHVLRDEKKYLCTLQQGISARQMEEMEAEGVILVVPKPYIHTYPKEYQKKIWTIKQFVSYVKHLQECNYKD